MVHILKIFKNNTENKVTYLLTALLRLIHISKSMHLKCIIQMFLIHSVVCITIT